MVFISKYNTFYLKETPGRFRIRGDFHFFSMALAAIYNLYAFTYSTASSTEFT